MSDTIRKPVPHHFLRASLIAFGLLAVVLPPAGYDAVAYHLVFVGDYVINSTGSPLSFNQVFVDDLNEMPEVGTASGIGFTALRYVGRDSAAFSTTINPETAQGILDYDFVEGRTHDGRKYRILSIIEAFAMEKGPNGHHAGPFQGFTLHQPAITFQSSFIKAAPRSFGGGSFPHSGFAPR